MISIQLFRTFGVGDHWKVLSKNQQQPHRVNLGLQAKRSAGMKTEIAGPYQALTRKSLQLGGISTDDVRWVLTSDTAELLPLLQAAYEVRSAYFANKVRIHILNNVQSGGCTEDCKYCAQSGHADTPGPVYPMQSEAEILAAARQAYEAGAFRHCMVFAGRNLGQSRIERICAVVEKIKARYPMQICVSAGFLSAREAEKLAAAGVNRYNHNLNTSSRFYDRICTSHDYRQRVATIATARQSGLEICSGVIIGMGESVEDIIQMTAELNAVQADSIPVNFFIPVPGHRLANPQALIPHDCLKVLVVFRLTNPKAEIRAAAGREHHLRSLQALSLYAANSIFAQGYLTTGGDDIDQVRQMILDAGFEIEEDNA